MVYCVLHCVPQLTHQPQLDSLLDASTLWPLGTACNFQYLFVDAEAQAGVLFSLLQKLIFFRSKFGHYIFWLLLSLPHLRWNWSLFFCSDSSLCQSVFQHYDLFYSAVVAILDSILPCFSLFHLCLPIYYIHINWDGLVRAGTSSFSSAPS